MRKILIISLLILAANIAHAGEGFWPFSMVPHAQITKALGNDVSEDVLSRLKRNTLSVGGFCTGALSGPNGLVVTNHHCVMQCLRDISTGSSKLLINGFKTTSREQEKRCPGLSIERQISDTDVSDRFRDALKGLDNDAYAARLDLEIQKLVSQCQAKDDLRTCRVAQYFDGSVFRLQQFDVYRDVRIVFAPETQMGQFGGYFHNFEFPRYAFDVAFLRLYQSGAPVNLPGWLRWRTTTPVEGEPVFVAGFPGGSARNFTTGELLSIRDGLLPWRIAIFSELRGLLIQFGKASSSNYAAAVEPLFQIENSLKRAQGKLKSLQTTNVFEMKAIAEKALIDGNDETRVSRKALQEAYETISAAERKYRNMYSLDALRAEYTPSKLLTRAMELADAVREYAKPEAERNPFYIDGNKETIENNIAVDFEFDEKLEKLTLEFGLRKMQENLGSAHPFIVDILSRDSAESLSKKIVERTQLHRKSERLALFQGGALALARSQDPLIKLAVALSEFYANEDRRFILEVDIPEKRAQQIIHRARWTSGIPDTYPDADGTMRLSYGRLSRVAGGSGSAGICTTFGEFSEKIVREHSPFDIPNSWKNRITDISPNQVFNCSTSNDFVAGNSGSVGVDTHGDIVGVFFDGNFSSLGGSYFYDERDNRSIMVPSRAIIEVIEKIYHVKNLF